MPDEKKKIVILGAGPAGLALALKLAQRPALPADVLVLEKKTTRWADWPPVLPKMV